MAAAAEPSAPRTRSRGFPQNFDEQKLEVLPLFENEAATVKISPDRATTYKRKRPSSEDYEAVTIPSNEVKHFSTPGTTTTKKHTAASSDHTRQYGQIEGTTESDRKSVVKESIEVSRVKEITSKRKVVRKKKMGNKGKTLLTEVTESRKTDRENTIRTEHPRSRVESKVPDWNHDHEKSQAITTVAPERSTWRVHHTIADSDNRPTRVTLDLNGEAIEKKTNERSNTPEYDFQYRFTSELPGWRGSDFPSTEQVKSTTTESPRQYQATTQRKNKLEQLTNRQTKERGDGDRRKLTTTVTPSSRNNRQGARETASSTARPVTQRVKIDEPKVTVSQVITTSRGTKKSAIKLSDLKNKSGKLGSEEEIDDSDNYPEPFKALIQAKKEKVVHQVRCLIILCS